MVNQPAYNPNDRDQVAASRYRNRAATDIFEPGSSIKPFIAAAGIASGRYHAEHRSSTPRRASCSVGIKTIPTSTTSAPISLTTVHREVEQRRHDQDGDDAVAAVDARHAARVRLRRSDRQRLSRRIGRTAERLVALAQDRPGDDFLRLRPVGDAAAAGARVRDSRRRRHQAAGDAASRRSARAGRARHRCARRAARCCR